MGQQQILEVVLIESDPVCAACDLGCVAQHMHLGRHTHYGDPAWCGVVSWWVYIVGGERVGHEGVKAHIQAAERTEEMMVRQ